MTLPEIQGKLSSNDLETLVLCGTRIESLIIDEKARGQQAEDKAKQVLSICGIGAAILGGLAGVIDWQVGSSLGVIIVLLFCAAVVVVARASYLSLTCLVPLLGNQVSVDLIFELQQYPRLEALRYDISVRIWVYERTVQINNKKLFYVHLALKHIVYLIVLLLLAGFFIIAVKLIGEVLAFILGLVLLVALVVLDPSLEKFGVSWKT